MVKLSLHFDTDAQAKVFVGRYPKINAIISKDDPCLVRVNNIMHIYTGRYFMFIRTYESIEDDTNDIAEVELAQLRAHSIMSY